MRDAALLAPAGRSMRNSGNDYMKADEAIDEVRTTPPPPPCCTTPSPSLSVLAL